MVVTRVDSDTECFGKASVLKFLLTSLASRLQIVIERRQLPEFVSCTSHNWRQRRKSAIRQVRKASRRAIREKDWRMTIVS